MVAVVVVVVVVVYNHRAEKATMTLQLFDFFVHLDTLTVDHSLLVLFSRAAQPANVSSQEVSMTAGLGYPSCFKHPTWPP